ncbi:hypothetical protein F511_21732 [Dorcoceras hygrometricum]|uniref:Uncharacterized protein n=1 Tax=Dorcoceras hygrometricum TaxID=472368 RepID=A0A2Z7BJJ8_9LAMI|nr:hypothetical protein F511_21732 [Dorcoceras hygrometricum]
MLSKHKLVWSRLELDDWKESELVSVWNSSGLVFVERSELDGSIVYIVVASYSGYAKLDIRSGCRSDVVWRNQIIGVQFDSIVQIVLVRGFSVDRPSSRVYYKPMATVHQIAEDLYMEDVDRAIAILLRHLENISSRELDIPAHLRTLATVHCNLFPLIPGGFSGYSAGRGGESAGDVPRG